MGGGTGLDNDCDGFVDDAGPLTGAYAMTVTDDGGGTVSWTPLAGANAAACTSYAVGTATAPARTPPVRRHKSDRATRRSKPREPPAPERAPRRPNASQAWERGDAASGEHRSGTSAGRGVSSPGSKNARPWGPDSHAMSLLPMRWSKFPETGPSSGPSFSEGPLGGRRPREPPFPAPFRVRSRS